MHYAANAGDTLTDATPAPPPGATVEQMMELLTLPSRIAGGVSDSMAAVSGSLSSTADSIAGAESHLVTDWPGPTSAILLRVMGAGWVVGGTGLIFTGYAISLGVGVAVAPVTAAGLVILGVTAVVIGATQLGLAQKMSGE